MNALVTFQAFIYHMTHLLQVFSCRAEYAEYAEKEVISALQVVSTEDTSGELSKKEAVKKAKTALYAFMVKAKFGKHMTLTTL